MDSRQTLCYVTSSFPLAAVIGSWLFGKSNETQAIYLCPLLDSFSVFVGCLVSARCNVGGALSADNLVVPYGVSYSGLQRNWGVWGVFTLALLRHPAPYYYTDELDITITTG